MQPWTRSARIVSLIALWPSASAAITVEDPGCGVIPVVQQSDQIIYPLARTLLRAGSDSVWTATRAWTSGQDYTLERTTGVLRLRQSPVAGETLWVRVCGLVDPPALEARFSTYRPARGEVDSATADSAANAPPMLRPGAQRSTTEAPAGTALAIQGNKTIAVDFGSNQDAALRQSLDLAVSGTLAPGVDLTGVLSDRNTPLTAAGSTSDLQSLDRLLIELRAPQGGAALGDVSLALDHGEFARIERRLQGVRGDWSGSGFSSVAAAASAEGEYQRLELMGVEGLQGPYQLTGPNGSLGIAVVAGSEVVTLDGERLTRGESADYSIDYERAQLTFTNRRPIGSSSRITADFQVAVNRFRRNLAAGALRWNQGPIRLAGAFLTEGDDRGRPLAVSLDVSDRLVLYGAGDSATGALGSGVTVGGGDYDLVIGSTQSYYAFAGPDSGDYGVSFALVGTGSGDYVDSAVVAGHVAYRFVGMGQGSYRVGRRLPLPDSHHLWDLSGATDMGALRLEVEGALSRLDRNTFSALDDDDNVGQAGSARLSLSGRSPGWLGGTMGIAAGSRMVGQRFEPFTRLERPFAHEDWGLATSEDFERQTRHEGSAFIRPGVGGELRGTLGWLETVSGFESLRRTLAFERGGRVITRALWERADGKDPTLAFAEGGRDRRRAELGLKLGWLEPAVRADWDQRWSPSDTGQAGARSRELAAELGTGLRMSWRALGGVALRREALLGAAGYRDQFEIRTARFSLQTPEGRRWNSAVHWQRRVQSPIEQPGRTVSDLASVRVSGTDPGAGWNTAVGLEVTSEGESQRSRQLSFVGDGLGAYDSLGNFVGAGQGDYTLAVTIDPALARIARAAGSVRVGWSPRISGTWQGSRVDLTLENEARRRGSLQGSDAWLTPGAALSDGDLSRAAVTQRFEVEVAPEARVGALRVRIERRVTADRSYTNFSQTQDQQTGSVRVRARPAIGWTGELEGSLERATAEQRVGIGAVERALRRGGVVTRIGYAPHARLRAAWVSDVGWAREPSSPEWSRTWRTGPEIGVSILTRGRLDWNARRGVASGPVIGPLLPTADPTGLVRWESITRFDYRLGDHSTLGLSMISRDREGRPTEHEGRAEARAFF